MWLACRSCCHLLQSCKSSSFRPQNSISSTLSFHLSFCCPYFSLPRDWQVCCCSQVVLDHTSETGHFSTSLLYLDLPPTVTSLYLVSVHWTRCSSSPSSSHISSLTRASIYCLFCSSLCTTLCLQWEPEIITDSCIYLSSLLFQPLYHSVSSVGARDHHWLVHLSVVSSVPASVPLCVCSGSQRSSLTHASICCLFCSSLCTTLCLQWEPEIITDSCIYLSSLLFQPLYHSVSSVGARDHHWLVHLSVVSSVPASVPLCVCSGSQRSSLTHASICCLFCSSLCTTLCLQWEPEIITDSCIYLLSLLFQPLYHSVSSVGARDHHWLMHLSVVSSVPASVPLCVCSGSQRSSLTRASICCLFCSSLCTTLCLQWEPEIITDSCIYLLSLLFQPLYHSVSSVGARDHHWLMHLSVVSSVPASVPLCVCSGSQRSSLTHASICRLFCSSLCTTLCLQWEPEIITDSCIYLLSLLFQPLYHSVSSVGARDHHWLMHLSVVSSVPASVPLCVCSGSQRSSLTRASICCLFCSSLCTTLCLQWEPEIITDSCIYLLSLLFQPLYHSVSSVGARDHHWLMHLSVVSSVPASVPLCVCSGSQRSSLTRASICCLFCSSLCTTLCLQWEPEIITDSCIYLLSLLFQPLYHSVSAVGARDHHWLVHLSVVSSVPASVPLCVCSGSQRSSLTRASICRLFCSSLCTTLCLQWEPEIIAVALIYLSSRLTKFEIQDWQGRPPHFKGKWWENIVEDVTLELLEGKH